MKIQLNSESAIPLSAYREVRKEVKKLMGDKALTKGGLNSKRRHRSKDDVLPKAERVKIKNVFKKQGYKGRRVYINFDGTPTRRIAPPKAVADYLKANGFILEDYLKGIVFDKHGRQVRLGKALKDPVAKKAFDNDSRRQATKKKHSIVISRHPYDVAGMSTDRGWTSCMELGRGVNAHFVPSEINIGTMVAYLIGSDDKNIGSPIARVLIKPFFGREKEGTSEDTVFWRADTVYPHNFTAASKFRVVVQKWCNKHLNAGVAGKFRQNNQSYEDGYFNRIQVADDEKTLEILRDPDTRSNAKTEVLVNKPDLLNEIPDVETRMGYLSAAMEAGASEETIREFCNAVLTERNYYGDQWITNIGSRSLHSILTSYPELLPLLQDKCEDQAVVFEAFNNAISQNPSIIAYADLDKMLDLKYHRMPREWYEEYHAGYEYMSPEEKAEVDEEALSDLTYQRDRAIMMGGARIALSESVEADMLFDKYIEGHNAGHYDLKKLWARPVFSFDRLNQLIKLGIKYELNSDEVAEYMEDYLNILMDADNPEMEEDARVAKRSLKQLFHSHYVQGMSDEDFSDMWKGLLFKRRLSPSKKRSAPTSEINWDAPLKRFAVTQAPWLLEGESLARMTRLHGDDLEAKLSVKVLTTLRTPEYYDREEARRGTPIDQDVKDHTFALADRFTKVFKDNRYKVADVIDYRDLNSYLDTAIRESNFVPLNPYPEFAIEMAYEEDEITSRTIALWVDAINAGVIKQGKREFIDMKYLAIMDEDNVIPFRLEDPDFAAAAMFGGQVSFAVFKYFYDQGTIDEESIPLAAKAKLRSNAMLEEVRTRLGQKYVDFFLENSSLSHYTE